MKKIISSRFITTSFILSLLALTSTVSATGLEGTNNIVCATMDVVACVDEQACIQGSAKSFELPGFIVLDMQKKVMRADYESGHKGSSAVKNMEKSEGQLIIQGIENGRGWNISINTKSGKMSAALAGNGVSFLAFGNCTSL